MTGLELTDVETALKYYAAYQVEIDQELHELWQAQERERQAWQQLKNK